MGLFRVFRFKIKLSTPSCMQYFEVWLVRFEIEQTWTVQNPLKDSWNFDILSFIHDFKTINTYIYNFNCYYFNYLGGTQPTPASHMYTVKLRILGVPYIGQYGNVNSQEYLNLKKEVENEVCIFSIFQYGTECDMPKYAEYLTHIDIYTWWEQGCMLNF